MSGFEIWIEALPGPGMENDADACFSHFDGVLDGLRRQGYTSDRIVADFTRGTKAMSAALVLAAVRHELSVLRYIQGERDGQGLVLAGREKVESFPIQRITMRRSPWMARGN